MNYPNYTHTLTVISPNGLLPISKRIAQAMDEGSEGGKGFDSIQAGVNDTTPTHRVASSVVKTALGEAIPYLRSNANALHAAVLEGFQRFPDETPPTLADVEAFLEGAKIDIRLRDEVTTLDMILADYNLVLIPPEQTPL